ncbi:MAG TPA: AAA family ATPase [Longimicrobium sp.]|jgi:hypothetical protein|uniref:AAA family ATPase n=1 Tax=Longimicrobium sp. TaxID=2029185 RepID=UPI002ED9F80A
MSPAELYDHLHDLASRAERRGDWSRPTSIASEVQKHVMDVLFTIARADGDISRPESAFLAELLASGVRAQNAQLRDMVRTFGRGDADGQAVLARVPHYFRVLVAGDQMRGTVNAANAAACIRELGLHLIAADGHNLPAEVALLTEHVGRLEGAVADAHVQQPRPELADGGLPGVHPGAADGRALLVPQPSPAPAAQADAAPQPPPATLDELMARLNRLVGLRRVKQEVQTLANLVRVRRMRQERGMRVPPMTLHMVFTGNPGTGKTTVARLLAEIFRALGVLSKGHLVETDRSGLVAGYVGQTAINVSEKVKAALGGMLFIDEAYALSSSDSGQDFGREAVDALVKLMEDNRADLIVVVAGYPAPMEKFLESNPGLRSRFNRFLNFDDYIPAELFAILERMCEDNGYTLSPEGAGHARAWLRHLFQNRGPNFGNGREVRNVFEQALAKHANRVGPVEAPTDEALCTLQPSDFPDLPEGVEPAPPPPPADSAEGDLAADAPPADPAPPEPAGPASAADSVSGTYAEGAGEAVNTAEGDAVADESGWRGG